MSAISLPHSPLTAVLRTYTFLNQRADLLAEMIGLARRSRVRAFNLELAWAFVINGSDAEVRREPVAPMLYV
jgi:hypothetical protein